MIIKSLLDTDFYKLTMMQLVYHHFKNVSVEYKFFCRDEFADFSPVIGAINDEINCFAGLTFSEQDLDYLRTFSCFKHDFLMYLREFRLNSAAVQLGLDGKQLKIRVRGLWIDTILFEVPILAIVSEIYNRHASKDFDKTLLVSRERLQQKIEFLQQECPPIQIVEFGTRRRLAFEWQYELLTQLKKHSSQVLLGTSNILLAKSFGLTPIGTMGHEYLQACQVLAPSLEESQIFALQLWWQEYGDELSIALTDVLGLDAFLCDFRGDFAGNYRGARHDSGDPIVFAEKMLAFYKKQNINSQQKTLVFSDGMDFKKAKEIHERFHNDIDIVFGIGGYLTHDTDIKRPNIVMKLVSCQQKPVGKLTDSVGKEICNDAGYLALLRSLRENKAADYSKWAT